MLFYRSEPWTGSRAPSVSEEIPRLPGHKQPSSQGLPPWDDPPACVKLKPQRTLNSGLKTCTWGAKEM